MGQQGTLEAFRRHIDRAIELGGAHCLGIGADLDGCDRLAAELAGVQDIPRLYAMLAAHGYEKTFLDALFYSNLLHVVLP